ncbi:hypothetical protein Hanom_Chr09g00798281 [Helianthus anomalus]
MIKRVLVLRIFLEKQAEFPLFLDAPNNASCRYFYQSSTRFIHYISNLPNFS